jgi:head-tail adaptor
MDIGALRHQVSLARSPQTTNDADGFYEPLAPALVHAAIVPISPGSDGRTTTHLITMRFHKQVTVDTRIVFSDPIKQRDREFFVRGIQNVDERNVELRCLCEEIEP